MATILTKRSNTASSVPVAGDLTNSSSGAELAVNTADKRLFTKDSGGTVVELGTNPSSLTLSGGTANGVAYLNGSKVLTTGSALQFDGSNLGLGVTPSAWSASYKALQMSGGGMALMSASGSGFQFSNAYFDGSFKYYANGAASMYANGGGAHAWYIAASGTAGNAISFTQAMTLDASGNLGVGTTSPAVKLHVSGPTGNGLLYSDGTVTAYMGTTGSNLAEVGTTTNHPYRFITNGSERARIDSSGRLLVGLTGTGAYTDGQFSSTAASTRPASTLKTIDTPSQSTQFIWNATDSGTRYFQSFVLGSSPSIVGSITSAGSSTSYNTTSDYRLKEDIQPMTGALAKVAALKPCTYKWKADGSDGEGFIAHELQAVVPQCVTGEKDAVDAEGKPVYQGIDTSFLVATLTAAIQELKAEFDAYKASHP